MQRAITVLFFLLFTCWPGTAQKGTAPNGFYPPGHFGDTYTGKVIEAAEHRITLEYSTKSKTEHFDGVTTESCLPGVKGVDVNVKEQALNAMLMNGSVITAFYSTKKTKQPDGSKKEEHIVLGYLLLEQNGQKLKASLMISCFSGPTKFMTFPYSGPSIGLPGSR